MKKKTFEGWFAYASDCEYGPTLVKFKGKGKPEKVPQTICDTLDDENWEEVFFFDERTLENMDVSYRLVKLRIVVELLEAKEDGVDCS